MCLFIVWIVIREKREAVIRSRMTIKNAILNLNVVNRDVLISALIVFAVKNSTLLIAQFEERVN